MEWNNEKTIEFIESYRQFMCLWRSEDPNYKNRILRTDAVRGLGEKYGITSKQVLNKIKSLRSYFHKEHSKITKKKSGSAASEIYQSSWFAYNTMLFILDGDTERSGTETQVSEYDTEDSNNTEIEESSEIQVVEDEAPPTGNQQPAGFAKPSPSIKRKKASSQVDEAYSFMSGVREKLSKQDRFSHFGEVIACKLRNLNDPRLQATAEFQINKIMFDMEIKMLDSIEKKRFAVDSRSSNNIREQSEDDRPRSSASTSYSGQSNPFSPELLSPNSEALSNDAYFASDATLLELKAVNAAQVEPVELIEFLNFNK